MLHGYPINELVPTLRALDYRWVGLAVAADLAVYVVHGWRWNTLLAPVARLSFWRTVQAIYIGLFANEVLPLRTGEVIRCYLLAHWNDLRLSLTFASAAVERIIDGIWMLAAFLHHGQLRERHPARPENPGAGTGRAASDRRRPAGLDRDAQAACPRGAQREPLERHAAPHRRRTAPDGQPATHSDSRR